jgi:CHAT domain-containing protein
VSPAECEARFAGAPEAEASALCFLETAERQPASWAESVRRVEGLLRRHPQHPWLTFYLGSLHWNRDPQRAAELYRQAAGLFARRRDAVGEVRARSNRYWQLLAQDREQEAAAEVELAVRAGEASGQPLALARARILEATHLSEHREDLQRADRLLLDAEELLGPDGPYRMRRDCLLQQGNVASNLGHLDEARRRFERLVDLTVREGDLFGEATARYNLLRVVRDQLALLPRPEGRSLSLELARRTLQVAEAAGQAEAVSKTHAVLGLVTRGAEAREHFQRCFAAAADAEGKSFCRSAQARSLTREDPAAAPAALDEALDLARKAEDPWALAYFWRERMRVSWRLDPPDVAVRDSLAALDAIEVMRDLQTGETGRAEVFSTWAGHYHWLAGRLLQEGDPALGFQVQERMRARALIDALEAGRAAPAISPESLKLQARRAAVLAEISQLQRRLLDRAETRRSELLAEVRRLEREEEDLREHIAKASPEFSALRRPGFATLEQVRAALAEDEALLSFQIAPWEDMVGDFMGGAWLTVVTRDGATVHPLRKALANRTQLRTAVDSFSGVIENGGDSPKGAAALYKALLADGLARLGPGVRKLVVVPDDVLHRLPFAVLRPEPGAPPLASSYEIALTPSATLWLRWRTERPPAAEIPALVLADPVPPATVKVVALERSAALAVPPSLGQLFWARREGESVVDSLGGGSELRVGDEASEAFLKQNGAERFALLHFATHAWTDDVEPERSFVLLAPGDAKEDGLLQVREIAGLDLRGRIVVLSACSSAAGEILRGEGVMGLARAFFQAGAHTVVASLWPLRDDHGAALFDRFYRHLAEGVSVAAALRAAQQDRLEAGAPPEAWAGVVVLGDGDRVPFPGGRPASWLLPAALFLLLASGLGVWAWLRRRRIYQ